MMKQEKSAGAVIYYYDSEKNEPIFLLLRYPTYWGFAKGWIENEESEEQAAKREIGEETGLMNVELINGFRYEQKWFYKFEGEMRRKEAVFFLVEVDSEKAKTVKISDEHEDFAWLNCENALKSMRVKSNKEMIKAAYERIKENKKQKNLF